MTAATLRTVTGFDADLHCAEEADAAVLAHDDVDGIDGYEETDKPASSVRGRMMARGARRPGADEDRSRLLAPEVEEALARAWLENGDIKARDKITDAYDMMVRSMAWKVSTQSGMPYEDLVQEGRLALLESMQRFEVDRGFRVGTLARWSIQGQLRRHVMDFFSVVRVGTTVGDKRLFANFRRLRAEIEAHTGRSLDDEGRRAIAAELQVDVNDVYRMETRLGGGDVRLDAVTASHDGEGRSYELADEREAADSVAIRAIDNDRLRTLIAELVAQLPERERKIVEDRHLRRERRDLQDIGEELGITKERVRQLEKRAMAHIRAGLMKRGIGPAETVSAVAC